MARGNSIFRHFCAAALLGSVSFCYSAEEKLIILNEGLWQADNGRLSYFSDGEMVSNQWFRDVNGYKLGDTPNDIIAVNDNLIAIAVNWSNVVQFITPEGKAVGAVESIPNVRCLASDGEYVYATSYAHECHTRYGLAEFKKGFVAKIDIKDFSVVGACEVGYEPEGIAFYDGHLFVANTGGYAFQEDHDYETTISIIDAADMTPTGEIDTGHENLCGDLSISGKYLCVNSAGDYYDNPGCGIIVDCEKALQRRKDCFATIPYVVSHNCTAGRDRFFAIGAGYSYLTGEYEFNCRTLDAAEIIESKGTAGYSEGLPGEMEPTVLSMGTPYGIYRNPFTGMIYATDADSFAGSGRLYQWSPEGEFIGRYSTYINPGKMIALRPDSDQSGALGVEQDCPQRASGIFDLQGRPVKTPCQGTPYIIDGKIKIFNKILSDSQLSY